MTDSKLESPIKLTSSKKYFGTQWVLMRIETLHGMMLEVEKVLGTGACLVWYTAGKGAGKSLANLIKKDFENYELKRICNLLIDFYANCGWGKSKILWKGEEEMVLRIWNNAFARKDSSKTPSCFFLKGFIEGILKELTQKCVKIEETKCVSKGDAYCEFRLFLK